ncbi:lamin tail domain-containing protein [candidate division KSB1 bacterium]
MQKLAFFIFLVPFFLSAQINDNFSDGDFTNNPIWTGNANQYEINSSKQLHLNSIGTDTSYLSTSNNLNINTEWLFYVKQSFNSSSNNYSRIYLVSDEIMVDGPLKGYYLQIGGTNDQISLYRQDSVNSELLIEGTIAYTGNSINKFNIKVLRSSIGKWELFSDEDTTGQYDLEGWTQDSTYLSTGYFGIFCKYTNSNSTKFYFDDFIVRTIQVDTNPPVLVSIQVIKANQLNIQFNEQISQTSGSDTNHYFIDMGIGNPYMAFIDSNNHRLVHLFFLKEFVNGNYYNIKIKQIEDLKGNMSDDFNVDFSFYKVKPYDVVINEIMADPEPWVGLPPYEYLELYNKTNHAINLKDWSLFIGSTINTLPEFIILPDSFLIITNDDSQLIFQTYGPSLGLFSSATSLSNTGTTIILSNKEGYIIHTISYNNQWYDNDIKANGGWSLEMIDSQNPCGETENWKASVHIDGGSPGFRNSVCHSNPDLKQPAIQNIYVKDLQNIRIFFTESLDSTNLCRINNYYIDHNIGNPAYVINSPPHFNSVQLGLIHILNTDTIYNLSIRDTIFDCTGNMIPLFTSGRFAVPKIAAVNDIVINEVLFNPKDQGFDFVEIINRSEKVIDLRDLVLSSYDQIMDVLISVKNITENGYLIFPGDYLVLTKNPEIVKQQYFSSNPDGFIGMSEFPSFANEEGVVVIADHNQKIIDRFSYNENMHFPLLNSFKGVSLERLSPDLPAENSSNWHSASESSGFATPAYKNSQFSTMQTGYEQINVEPKVFSPDNDGYNDLLKIQYIFDKPGFVANITIYDAMGRLITYLVKNELLGTNGCFFWDGINEQNEKANIGVYIIFIEIFDLEGHVKKFKKSVVLGGKL